MNGMCIVVIAGNLTRDPEIRYLPSGSAIASFDLAVNRKWKDNGETKEEVSFIPITAFGKQAETIGQYLKKGRPLLVHGRLRQENWTDKNTQQKRSKLSVVAESFSFLDSGNGGGQAQADRSVSASDLPPNTTPAPGTKVAPEDEVPFAHPPRSVNPMRLA
jgi:single-strand DNA-binding protein